MWFLAAFGFLHGFHEWSEMALIISVTSYGSEIASGELPRIFERFYRRKQVEGRKTADMGLGLYVAKGLVEAQGGRMWVESTGGTTIFRFTLPTA